MGEGPSGVADGANGVVGTSVQEGRGVEGLRDQGKLRVETEREQSVLKGPSTGGKEGDSDVHGYAEQSNGSSFGNKGIKISFRDKVVGGVAPKPLIVDESLDGDRLAVVTGRNGGASRPRVTFTDEGKKVLSEPYLDSIVIKVLGKRVSYTAIVHRLKFIWRLKGGYEVLDVGFGYFLVKCDLKEDREKILLGGPWMIDGHYLAVKPWTISFRPAEESFGTTLVWIRITGLNIHYYQEKAMRRIATAVGDPIKVDVATKEAERGKFARACVLIDLGSPVIDEIEVDDLVYKVEYESLALVYKKCRCYGHLAVDCKSNVGVSKTAEGEHKGEVAEDDSGPAMFVFGENVATNQEILKAPDNAPDKEQGKEISKEIPQHVIGKGDATDGWTQVVSKKGNKKIEKESVKKAVRPRQIGPIKKKIDALPKQQQRGTTVKVNQVANQAWNKYAKASQSMKLVSSPLLASIGDDGNHGTTTTTLARKRVRPNSLQNSPQDGRLQVLFDRSEESTAKESSKGKEVVRENHGTS